jgi:hypothetical protein
VNIGQNNAGNAMPTTPMATPQVNVTNIQQQATNSSSNVNIPGVMAGGLDFSNIARSIGSMVQGLTGRLIPGGNQINLSAAAAAPSTILSSAVPSGTATSSSSHTSTSGNSTSAPQATSNSNETDTVTEHMLTGRTTILDNHSILCFLSRTVTFIGRWSR